MPVQNFNALPDFADIRPAVNFVREQWTNGTDHYDGMRSADKLAERVIREVKTVADGHNIEQIPAVLGNVITLVEGLRTFIDHQAHTNDSNFDDRSLLKKTWHVAANTKAMSLREAEQALSICSRVIEAASGISMEKEQSDTLQYLAGAIGRSAARVPELVDQGFALLNSSQRHLGNLPYHTDSLLQMAAQAATFYHLQSGAALNALNLAKHALHEIQQIANPIHDFASGLATESLTPGADSKKPSAEELLKRTLKVAHCCNILVDVTVTIPGKLNANPTMPSQTKDELVTALLGVAEQARQLAVQQVDELRVHAEDLSVGVQIGGLDFRLRSMENALKPRAAGLQT